MDSARQGFALLATLWLLAALTVLGSLALAVARVGTDTTRNRMTLARAAWAREACLAILEARYTTDSTTRDVDTVALGRGTWCVASTTDPSAWWNVNATDEDPLGQLLAQLGVPEATRDAMIEDLARRQQQGPIVALEELKGLPAWDVASYARVAPFLTARGPGAVNVNAAPPEVLGALPGFTTEAVTVATSERNAGHPLASLEDLGARLSSGARRTLYGSYEVLSRFLIFTPRELTVVIRGGVRGMTPTATATITTAPLPGRLAVLRRESE